MREHGVRGEKGAEVAVLDGQDTDEVDEAGVGRLAVGKETLEALDGEDGGPVVTEDDVAEGGPRRGGDGDAFAEFGRAVRLPPVRRVRSRSRNAFRFLFSFFFHLLFSITFYFSVTFYFLSPFIYPRSGIKFLSNKTILFELDGFTDLL